MKKAMATHYSILAWRILWTEEPGRLQPMGSQRVDLAQTHASKIYQELIQLDIKKTNNSIKR